MKKIVIPIIITAFLGIGGGVAAIMLNRPSVEQSDVPVELPDEVPEVKNGKYYLNGDKTGGLWIEITPDFLTLKGDDVDTFLMNYAKKKYSHFDNADDAIKTLYNDLKLIYCGEKRYSVNFVSDNSQYAISVGRGGEDASSTDPRETGTASFRYNKAENLVHCSLGDFILVE